MKKAEYIERYGEEAWKKYLEKCKQYYQQHREDKKKYCKQYKKQHREECKQYQKGYQKEYYKQHREDKKEYSRKNRCMFAFCISEEVEQIENYELAKADNFKGWDIHHRLETHNSDGEKRLVNLSRDELKSLDMYYNRPASELIFLTKSEHTKLHRKKNNREVF